MRILITGGCGFIGSHLVRYLLKQKNSYEILNIDALTYAGNKSNLSDVKNLDNYSFSKVNIRNRQKIRSIFNNFRPSYVLHLAAETHVDRSIDNPGDFLQTNIIGTSILLEEAERYRNTLDRDQGDRFRFVYISTDEVFGSLKNANYKRFDENSKLLPNSPYAASKAAGDLLARAWFQTYGLPVMEINCTNNYGPFQFPEKLIPMVILAAINSEPIPIYGKGDNLREWIYVEDFVASIFQVMLNGKPGESYNVGSGDVISNITIANKICYAMDKLSVDPKHKSYSNLIEFVDDRPGHDFCYAVDSDKIRNKLGWCSDVSLDEGLKKTVSWYVNNRNWWEPLRKNVYAGERLGRL
jgi:dTDP-glucose 4,6-dehydratase